MEEENKENNEPRALTLVEQAEAAGKELGAKIAEFNNLKKEMLELQTREILAGKSNGRPQEEVKEESPAEYRKRIEQEIQSGKYL